MLIPVNCPETNKNVKVCMYQRDGQMNTSHNQGGAPNYHRNNFQGPIVTSRAEHIEHATFESGMCDRFEAEADDNFSQPRTFYTKVLTDQGRKNLIDNIVEHLSQCTDKEIIKRCVAIFANVDDDFGKKLAEKLKVDLPKK